MKEISKTAPVVLFVYKRLSHTSRTIERLSKNSLASESDLIIYSDAARNDNDIAAVEEVRRLVHSTVGFRTVTVVERQSNYGLARNIIEGVGEVCQRYGRVIVLEDDLVTSPYFLSYMNQALNHYQEEKKIWHISGWNYPIATDGLEDVLFIRVMNCWGWATWSDRWMHFEKNTEKLIAEFDKETIRKFDLNNSGMFWYQVLANKKNLVNTWAIYWYATIFKNNGLCVNPKISLVDNIGLDGSGTHGSEERESYKVLNSINSIGGKKIIYPSVIIENEVAIGRIMQFYKNIKPTLLGRIKNRIIRLIK